MEILLANAEKAEPKKLWGRDYLVAPVTLIVPGVLSGSQGSIFYPEDEVEKWPGLWNHVPLVVYHPTRNGNHVTARDPEVLDQSGIGLILRDTYSEGKRRAEAWFDVEATRKVDLGLPAASRILPRLQSGKPIEISTGLDLDKEAAPEGAAHNGQGYYAVARNFRPDHLAILPDAKGACSNQDGCGVNVNEEIANGGPGSGPNPGGGGTGTTSIKSIDDGFKESSYEQITESVTKALSGKSAAQIKEAAKEAKMTLTSSSKEGMLKEIITRIKERKGSWERTQFRNLFHEGEKMNRKEMIQYLTANCDCWKDKAGKGALAHLPDASLAKLVGNTKTVIIVNQIKNKKSANAGEGDEAVAGVPWTELAALLGVELNPADDPIAFAAALKEKVDEISSKLSGGAPEPEVTMMEHEEEEEEPVAMAAGSQEVGQATEPDAPVGNRRKKQTSAEWLKTAPPEIRSAVTNAMLLEKQGKIKLVQRLVGNIADAAKRQAMGVKLMAKTLGDLQEMASLIPEAPAVNHEIPNFAFAGGAGVGSGTDFVGNDEETREVLDLESARNAWEEEDDPRKSRRA